MIVPVKGQVVELLKVWFMKKHLFALAIMAFALYACGPTYVVHQDPPPAPAPPPPSPEPEPEVSYQSFYDQLSPYGQWVDDPNYGYAWLPDAGPDFRPYATNGQWVYTADGWTWASNYPWGWATFHYGRWFFQDGYGWMWVPGTEWAPAWVSWRSSPDYYGWAPLGPNVNIDAAYGGGYNPPPQYWCFVPHQYVGSPQIRNYYVNPTRNVTIINNTTIIRNTTIINNQGGGGYVRNVNYGRGPDPQEVGRYSGTTIRPYVIRQSNAPGEQVNNGTLAIYRPRVSEAPQGNSRNGNGNASRVAPSRVQPLNNVRPVNTAVYGRNDGGSGRNNGGNRNDGRFGNDNRGNDNRDNRSFNRPVTQPVDQQFNRPAVQPGNQQPANQQFNRPATQPVNQQPGNQQFRPATQPVNQQPNQQPFNRPYNQPSSAPVNQGSANQVPVNQGSAGQPIDNRSFNRPATQPANQQFNRPAMQPVNQQPGNQPFNRPVTQSGNQQPANQQFRPATQPVNQQPANQQPVNRPAVQPVNRPVTQPGQSGGTRPAPAANPSRPAPREVSPPPAPKKDGNGRDVKQQ